MKSLTRVWCGVALASAGLAVAEPKKDSSFKPINSDAAELITPIKPVPPPPNAQQGNNQQGQFPPGQGPNTPVPPPPQGAADLPAVTPQVPDVKGSRPEEHDAAKEAAAIQGSLETIRPGRLGLDLNQLDADDARGKGTDAASRFNRRDPEMDAGVEALRGLTKGLGSNRDGWSDTTKGYASAITTDPGAMLSGVKGGLAKQGGSEPGTVSVGGGEVGQVKTVRHGDGSTTETYHRGPRTDGVYTDETVERNPDGTMKSQTIVDHHPGGWYESRTATRLPSGQWDNTRQVRDASGHGRETERWTGPAPHVNVDPDSGYGQGSGDLPGKKRKTVWDSVAGSHTPGGRPPPDDQGGVGGPRLNVDVDLTGQPNPDAAAGGSAVGRTIRNPNDDTVDPPRPIK